MPRRFCTDSVSALLVLAKTVAKLNNEAKLVRDARPVPVRPPGSLPTPEYLALEAIDNLNQVMRTPPVSRSTPAVILHLRVTLGYFGDM